MQSGWMLTDNYTIMDSLLQELNIGMGFLPIFRILYTAKSLLPFIWIWAIMSVKIRNQLDNQEFSVEDTYKICFATNN